MPRDNFCLRRQRLYQRYLDQTAEFLSDLTDPSENGRFASKATEFGGALADQSLIDALEEVLIPYVLYGVMRDLERLRKSGALFRVDKSGQPPPLELVLPTGGTSPDDLPGYTQENRVSPHLGYIRYFDRYINPANVAPAGQEPKSGIDTFFDRYPLIKYAVETVTSHYQSNIELACERVCDDWDDLGKAFFEGRQLSRLSKIRTTGNDFHKGGKQVLILTFEVAGNGPGATETGRVVYKPSAVEIDCRIVGDSSIFTPGGVSPKGPLDDAGYTQDASLTELINKYNPAGQGRDGFTTGRRGGGRQGFVTRALPTYRILPYNRGSVAMAYGYIEFLTHAPDDLILPPVDPGVSTDPDDKRPRIVQVVAAAVMEQLSQAAVAKSDWITADPKDARVFYHQFGGIMAMATAISLSDVHVQNVIVHDRRPHLIDLEEALKKPMKDASETYVLSTLDRRDDPEAPVVQTEGDFTSDLRISSQGRWWKAQELKPASSVLYVYRGAAEPATPATTDPPDETKPPRDDQERERRKRDRMEAANNARALVIGLTDVVEALAAGSAEVATWLGGLRQTIARYVTRGTETYATFGRKLFLQYAEADVASLKRDGTARAPNGWYNHVNSNGTLGTTEYYFRQRVAESRASWKPKPGWNPPFFALDHPDHAWRDYLNCDVPCFYHFLGEAELRNSAGEKVDVDKAVEWQDLYVTGKPVQGWSGAEAAYLPRTAVDVVGEQLRALKDACADPETKQAFLNTLIGTNDSLKGALSSMIGSPGSAGNGGRPKTGGGSTATSATSAAKT